MGIKRNFVYSAILTVANYIFPLIVYPYISRVLGVTNIGICNFVDSIINYFILISMMGVSTIGIREIAKNKNDKLSLQKSFSSIFLLNAIFTLIMLVALFVSIALIPKLNEHKEMMWLGAVKLLFNLFLVEWFFKGLEDFKYITYRSIIVKIFFVIGVFIFVRHSDDYIIYYALLIASIVLTSFFNWNHLHKYTSFIVKNISFSEYKKSFFILGIYALLTSMYTSFNVAFLGFTTTETEVGYYTTAVKLYAILLSLFAAYTGVMMPRMSVLVAEGNIDELKILTSKSYNILFTFSLPTIILSMFFAPQIIYIISGPGYEGAILPMRIVMPLMLIIGIEQILVYQILMPLKKDKAVFINSIVGTIVGVLLNVLLVSSWKSVGSSIVWFSSEFAVLITAQLFVTKYLKIHFPFKNLLINIFYSLPLIIICFSIQFLNLSDMLSLLLTIGMSCIYIYIVQVYILKNELVLEILRKVQFRL